MTAKTKRENEMYSITTVLIIKLHMQLEAATVCHCYLRKTTFIIWFGMFPPCGVTFVGLCFA